MIFLIDDNKSNQQESYGCGFIKQGLYKEHLTFLKGIPTPERADFIDELPNKAKVILFHSTSKDMDKNGNLLETTETIGKIYNNIKTVIPYVGFSWGHTSHIATYSENSIDSMNKRIFYLNFEAFILDYIKNKNVHDFKILSNGVGYKKEILIEQGRKLIQEILDYPKFEPFICGNDALTYSLDVFLKNSQAKINISDFCSQNSNKLSHFELTQLINKSIESIQKYGKNLYY